MHFSTYWAQLWIRLLFPRVSSVAWLKIQGLWGSKAHWNIYLLIFLFPDWGFSPRAWDRRGNRVQVGDLQQGFMINVCGEEEEQRGQEGETTMGSYVP